METVLQFGAGNFLRAFVDTFVEEINASGQDVGRIVVVQTTGDRRAKMLNAQSGRFHVVVRGMENGVAVDRAQEVGSISRALAAQTEWSAVRDVAVSSHLRAVVSNTTEAGFALDPADGEHWWMVDQPPESFPAKLLWLLRERYASGEGGLAILPCELISDNGDRLRELVGEQASRWKWDLERDFMRYINDDCTWVNSLVDRIVSGKPESHPLLASDPLLTVTEPFAFWAVEHKPATEWLGHSAIHRVPDVAPYALRKVRILNGAHSALVGYVRKHGRSDISLVREAVADSEIAPWLRDLLFAEIVPTVAGAAPDAETFAEQTLERFANPFLDHKLSDIALHHETKVGVRLAPTRDEFREKFGREPRLLNEILNP